jgi:hypothetical protein
LTRKRIPLIFEGIVDPNLEASVLDLDAGTSVLDLDGSMISEFFITKQINLNLNKN